MSGVCNLVGHYNGLYTFCLTSMLVSVGMCWSLLVYHHPCLFVVQINCSSVSVSKLYYMAASVTSGYLSTRRAVEKIASVLAVLLFQMLRSSDECVVQTPLERNGIRTLWKQRLDCRASAKSIKFTAASSIASASELRSPASRTVPLI